MGAIKQKLAEFADMAEEILDSGVSDQELDEFMEAQLSSDEYEMYHAHKDIIFGMLGFGEEDDEYEEIDPMRGPYGHDNPDTIENNEMDESYNEQNLSTDEMADDIIDHYELWYESLKLGEEHLLDSYTKEQQEWYLKNREEVLNLAGLSEEDDEENEVLPHYSRHGFVDNDPHNTDEFDEDKMREDLFDPQDDPTDRNIVTGEMDESYIMLRINEDSFDEEDLDEGALGTSAASLIMRGKGSGSYHNVKGKTEDSGDKYEWKKFVDPERWYNSLDKEEDEEDEEENKVDEGCNCGGKRPPVRRPGLLIRRPAPRPTPIKKKLHEKFIEKSDPIKDMEIGINPKKIAKKFLNAMFANISRVALIYFGSDRMQGHAEVLYGFFKNIEKGMTPQDAFYESCADENFDGSRKDVVEDRILIANVIKKNFKIDVIYNDERLMPESKDEIFMNSLNEVDYEWMTRNNREDDRAPRFAYGQRTYVDPKKVIKNAAPEYDYNERKSALGHIGRKQEILKDMGYDLDDEIEMPEIAPTKKEIKTLSPTNKQFPDNKFNKLKSEYDREEILMDRLFKKHLKGSKID